MSRRTDAGRSSRPVLQGLATHYVRFSATGPRAL